MNDQTNVPFFTIEFLSNEHTVINLNNPFMNNDYNSQLNSHNSLINIFNTFISELEMPILNPNLFENVTVTLDDSEFKNLNLIKLETAHENDCTICMCKMDKDETIIELKCLHTFHSNCIETYLKQYNYKCPICRSEVGKSKYNL